MSEDINVSSSSRKFVKPAVKKKFVFLENFNKFKLETEENLKMADKNFEAAAEVVSTMQKQVRLCLIVCTVLILIEIARIIF